MCYAENRRAVIHKKIFLKPEQTASMFFDFFAVRGDVPRSKKTVNVHKQKTPCSLSTRISMYLQCFAAIVKAVFPSLSFALTSAPASIRVRNLQRFKFFLFFAGSSSMAASAQVSK